MPTSRRPLFLACLFFLAVLTSCVSGPPKPPRSRVARGGFSVLVDGPDRPAAPRVIADIGSYAQGRGFVRQPALPGPPTDPITRETLPTAPERYQRGGVELEVSHQPADHRVSAYLHGGTEGDRRLVTGFYHDFDQVYAPRYGGNDPISEIGFADDSGGPSVQERPAGASVPNSGGSFQGGGGGMGGGMR